jgi:hypothetical protein
MIGRMARFLIVDADGWGEELAVALEGDGHVAIVLGCERSLGELLAALDHVAIVCWLSPEVSPARFLAGAIDSSMRGFAYRPGEWAEEVSETAARNSIPTVSLSAEPAESRERLTHTLKAVNALLDGRYAGTYI